MPKQKYWNGTGWEVLGTDAVKVDLTDSEDLFVATNVEDALAEVKNEVDVHLDDYATFKGTVTKFKISDTKNDADGESDGTVLFYTGA